MKTNISRAVIYEKVRLGNEHVFLPPQMYTIACFGVDSDLLDSIFLLQRNKLIINFMNAINFRYCRRIVVNNTLDRKILEYRSEILF